MNYLKKVKNIKIEFPVYLFFLFFIVLGLTDYIRNYFLEENREHEIIAQNEAYIPLYKNYFTDWLLDADKNKDQVLLNKLLRIGIISDFSIYDFNGKIIWHSDNKINEIINNSREKEYYKSQDLISLNNDTLKILPKFDSGSTFLITNKNLSTLYIKLILNGKEFYIRGDSQPDSQFPHYFASLFLYALLPSLILSLIVLGLLYPFWTIKNKMKESILDFIQAKNIKTLHIEMNNEVGELAGFYDKLISSVSLSPAENHQNSEDYNEISDDNSRMESIYTLQTKLFSKPFPKLSWLDMTLFPKNPRVFQRSFMNATGEGNQLDILLGYYDIINLDSSLQKHKLQSEFFGLIKNLLSFASVVKTLNWKLLSHINLGPALALISINNTEKKMQLYRSAPIYIFSIDTVGNIRYYDMGTEYYDSEEVDIQEYDIKVIRKLIIVTRELMELLNFSIEEFEEKILLNIDLNLRSKDFIVALLGEISAFEKIRSSFNGLISVINFPV